MLQIYTLLAPKQSSRELRKIAPFATSHAAMGRNKFARELVKFSKSDQQLTPIELPRFSPIRAVNANRPFGVWLALMLLKDLRVKESLAGNSRSIRL